MRPLNQDNEQLGVEPPTLGAVENAADEANILSDQDETQLPDPSANDPNMGSDGTENFALDAGDFARGEIDVKEQMDRTMAKMDAGHHRPRDPAITPHSRAGAIDSAEALQDSLDNRLDKETPGGTRHGHETGAYTDLGAGKSGVTREKR